jgi:hypothetical protein
MDLANKTLSELKAIASELGVFEGCANESTHGAIENTHGAIENTHGAIATFTGEGPPNRGEGKGRIEAFEPSRRCESAFEELLDNPRKPSKSLILNRLQSSIKNIRIVDRPQKSNEPINVADDNDESSSPVTFSPKFLSLYRPPLPYERAFIPDANGQLNLLEFVDLSDQEPPDFDDYSTEFEFWAAYDAWCDRHPDIDVSEFSEPIEIELASMCEWAPCPDEWYEIAETIEIIETTSSTLEEAPVPNHNMTFATFNFFIPIFDDRNSEDPPTAGSFARLPTGPKGFPPTSSVAKFARAKTTSERSPPGGDA